MSAMTSAEHSMIQAVIDAIQTLPNGLRQAHTDELWAQIGDTVDESTWAAAVPVGPTVLTVAPQTSGLELIETAVIATPPGVSAVLVLGSTTLPIVSPGQVLVLGGIRKQLGPSDLRQLTITNAGGAPAGPAALWLMGHQQPTFGVLAK